MGILGRGVRNYGRKWDRLPALCAGIKDPPVVSNSMFNISNNIPKPPVRLNRQGYDVLREEVGHWLPQLGH